MLLKRLILNPAEGLATTLKTPAADSVSARCVTGQ